MLSLRSLEGKTIGHYLIQKKVGSGGQAAVFQAQHRDFETTVAIKFLHEHFVSQPEIAKRFRKEAKVQFRLQHPGIVRVLELIDEPPLLGMAMDWVSGQDLDSFLETHKRPLSFTELQEIFLPVLDAVGYAHDNGIIHRDLKPSNILLATSQGHFLPKVMDFGIAKSLENPDKQTQTNTLIGTLHYIAPEQAASSKSVDRRADIYSLGVTLYQLLTNRLPFDGKDTLQLLLAHVSEEPPPLRSWNPNTDPRFQPLIDRALAKSPNDRFQTCREFADALLPLLRSPASSIESPPTTSRPTVLPTADISYAPPLLRPTPPPASSSNSPASSAALPPRPASLFSLRRFLPLLLLPLLLGLGWFALRASPSAWLPPPSSRPLSPVASPPSLASKPLSPVASPPPLASKPLSPVASSSPLASKPLARLSALAQNPSKKARPPRSDERSSRLCKTCIETELLAVSSSSPLAIAPAFCSEAFFEEIAKNCRGSCKRDTDLLCASFRLARYTRTPQRLELLPSSEGQKATETLLRRAPLLLQLDRFCKQNLRDFFKKKPFDYKPRKNLCAL